MNKDLNYTLKVIYQGQSFDSSLAKNLRERMAV